MHVRTILAGAALGLLPAVLAATAASGTQTTDPRPARDPVSRWVEHRGAALSSVDPGAPDADLTPLRQSVGGARIVGLGEAAHRLAEVTTLRQRALQYLVKRMGFRSIAWEEDWSLGTQINDYVLGRRDDRDALVGQMSKTAWRTREVADVLTWLRAWNDTHRDEVRFFGVEYFATRPFAYDRVEQYVADAAPDVLPQAQEHLSFLQPFTEDMGEYLEWFRDEVEDKQAYVRSAERLHDLVAAIPHRPGDHDHALAEHVTRQIRAFYTAFTIQGNYAFRDARAAENLRWWERFSGDKIVYWAASAHTADVPDLTITLPPPFPDARFASVGSYLRDWYGRSYRSVGFTFDHGVIAATPGNPVDLPAPLPEWFEHPLGNVDTSQFLYDVRRPAPRPVRDWLARPMVTRGGTAGGRLRLHDERRNPGPLVRRHRAPAAGHPGHSPGLSRLGRTRPAHRDRDSCTRGQGHSSTAGRAQPLLQMG
ncbi:MAG: erythromycin esterase family protein [Nocardioidaceae bacterium]